MKKSLLLFCLISLTISSCSDDPVTGGGNLNNEKLQRMVDSLTNFYYTERNITNGGFLIKINTNSGNYFASGGIVPVPDENSHLRLCSITKTFNAAAVMLLHQQGKVNINDLITGNFPGTSIPYLPASPDYEVPYKDQITLKLLLEHRAGVFDVTNDPIPASVPQPYAGQQYAVYIMGLPGNEYHTFTFDEMVGVAAINNLSYFPPGQQYHYSNTGYHILAKIIERASGLTWSEFVNTNFFQPLSLNNTSSVWSGNDTLIPSPYVESFFYLNGVTTNTTWQNMSSHVSEGNVISTPGDITKWINLLITGQAGINMSNVELMKQTIPTGENGPNAFYGLGICYIDGLGYGHTGALPGYLLIDFYNPSTGVTVLAASNFWDYTNVQSQNNGMIEFAINALNAVQ
ncbi:MAG: serine hydrolase [Ignavibacteria bacterium]|nr:serine hydrolase [Ignavibacteria bacterium]